MSTHTQNPITRVGATLMRGKILPALIAVLNLIPAGLVTAQTFTTLYYFTATHTNSSGVYTNGDGANPYAGLMLSGNTLYGTAEGGGSSGYGTVLAVNTDGTGFTNLHSFTGGSDGAYPFGGLILSGNTLYGTAAFGGRYGYGTVFALNSDGTGFTNLYSFTGYSDGAVPYAGLILSGNTLYGTAYYGGSYCYGTVFALNTDGTGFTTLHSFTGYDGAYPHAGLVLSGNTLYGTASRGGSSDSGTVFAVNTDGTGFKNLHSFTATSGPSSTNSDGAVPPAGLLLSGNTLYGTAELGGSSGVGTVFKVNTNGTGFTNLHSFTSGTGYPYTGLILSGNTLYGTAAGSGVGSDNGTVFAVNSDGTGFTTLHSFNYDDGASPQARLVLSGNTLYGTARGGGSSGNGTVFTISFQPQLTITPSGANVILRWPPNVAGFDYTGYTLQDTTNLGPSAVWETNSPAPVVIAGQNTVTNPITGPQKFYRLIQ